MQRLEATVQQLLAQLQQDSRTSSRPPSSDPPQAWPNDRGASPRASARWTTRSPRGRPGRWCRSKRWTWWSPSSPSGVPTASSPLQGEDPQPQRHQVTEIPPVQASRHRVSGASGGLSGLWRTDAGGVCPRECRRGLWPARAGDRRRCVRGPIICRSAPPRSCLDDLFGVAAGPGDVAHLEQATAQAVAGRWPRRAPTCSRSRWRTLDETGWRQGQQRAWLWVAVTTWVTVFVVRLSRGGKVARELLGKGFWGWLVTDRCSAYNWYPTLAAAAVLGTSAARHRSDDRAGWSLAGDRRGPARPGPPDVPLVASGP